MEWKIGDKVIWRHAITREQDVIRPAVVRGFTKHRVSIQVLYQLRGETWTSTRAVKAESLEPRAQLFKELDDE